MFTEAFQPTVASILISVESILQLVMNEMGKRIKLLSFFFFQLYSAEQQILALCVLVCLLFPSN